MIKILIKISVYGLIFFAPALNAQIQSGAAFLKILPGARQQGLANSLTGGLDDTHILFANPGSIGFYREWQWSAGYTEWIADIFNASLLYGRQFRFNTLISDRLNFAVGVQYQGVREFDSSRGAAAPASAKDFLLSGSLGSPINIISKNVSWGVTAKYFRSELAGFNASSVNYDFGLLYKSQRFKAPSLTRYVFKYAYWSIGAGLLHNGKALRFLSTATPLPRTFRSGAALNLGTHDGLQVQIATDILKVRDEDLRLSFGAEIKNLFSPIHRGIGRLVDVRGGYNFDNDLFSKISVGLSFRLDDYTSLPLKNIAPKNSAMQLDLGIIDNNEFFSSVYRGSVTHYSIQPEKFKPLELNRNRFSELNPAKVSWRSSSDPDLYDEVNYFLFQSLGDSLALAQLINDIEEQKIDIFEKIVVAQILDSVSVQKVVIEQPQFTSIDAIRPIKAQISADTLVFYSIEADKINFRYDRNLTPGKYFWSVMVYDNNQHFRFIGGEDTRIHSFVMDRVLRPDLTINITKKTVIKQPELLQLWVEPIRFRPDSSSLSSENKALLSTWGSTIINNPDIVFEAAGHADRTGPSPESYRKKYNQALSLLRAENIVNWLTSQKVQTSQLIARGYGEANPIKLANTAEVHFQNRRVELKIHEDNRTSKVEDIASVKFVNQGQRQAGMFSVAVYSLGHPIDDQVIDNLGQGMFSFFESGSGHGRIAPEYVKIVTVGKLAPGDSLNIDMPFDQARPYIVAVVDKENYIAESNEKNNWYMASFNTAPKTFPVVDPDRVSFDFDSFGLTEETMQALTKVVSYLNENSLAKIKIIGHTDDKGTEEYNLALSQKRAYAVKDFFVKNQIVQDRLFATGFGENQPVVKGDSEEARAKNRRVEIKLFDDSKKEGHLRELSIF